MKITNEINKTRTFTRISSLFIGVLLCITFNRGKILKLIH